MSSLGGYEDLLFYGRNSRKEAVGLRFWKHVDTFFISKIFPMISLMMILKSRNKTKTIAMLFRWWRNFVVNETLIQECNGLLWKILNSTNFHFALCTIIESVLLSQRYQTCLSCYIVLHFSLSSSLRNVFWNANWSFVLCMLPTVCLYQHTNFKSFEHTLKWLWFWFLKFFIWNIFSSTGTTWMADKREIRNFCLGSACWSVILENLDSPRAI